jgi:hypothetical protein
MSLRLLEWRQAAGVSAGFFDYDNDESSTSRHALSDWSFKTNCYCGEQKPRYRAYCHPDNYEGATSILYHNNGDGTFTDVSPKPASPIQKAKGVTFADYDGDGSPTSCR